MSDQVTGSVTIGGAVYEFTAPLVARDEKPLPVSAEIRAEALKGPGAPHALPLVASWCTGTVPDSFDPAYQLRSIAAGHHLWPWFQFPEIEASVDAKARAYYQAALQSCQGQGLPLTLVGTQWEQRLYQESETLKLPAAENPNVVLKDGTIRPQLSPFGPTEPWFNGGKRWTSGPLFQQLMVWCPAPSKVVLLSNNEANRLQWKDATDDRRCPPGLTDDQKRKAVGDGWITRYRALQAGMRAGLTSAWASVTRFWAYGAFGPPHLGRWGFWNDYGLATAGRLDPSPLMWDGGSSPYYTPGGTGVTDFQVMSPQLEAMNLVPMQTEAVRLNPDFDLELSVWDGWEPGPQDQRAYYAALGQTYTPARYGGYAQWGLWLLRPRVLRDYRAYTDTLSNSERYFLPLVAAVDRVYANADLKRFWRDGALVENLAQAHPYQTALTAEQAKLPRWYGLDTSADPPRSWSLQTPLPVRALALVLGAAPRREWLIYAHAPTGARNGVTVTIPGSLSVVLDVPVAGGFWRVTEANRAITRIGG